ncbi:MAG: phosphatase PAP2 family protein [Chthoniobacterales bacterium]
MKASRSCLIFYLLLAILSLGLIVVSFQFDTPVRNAILEKQGKDWKKTSNYEMVASISKYGDWPQLALIGVIGIAIAARLRSRRWTEILAAALIASTAAGILANFSRLSTGRTRPRESPKIEQGFYGPWHDGKLTVGNSKFNSFPSGHTATAVGFAAPFLFARTLLSIPIFTLALLIAWSRMALGAHHLSDVVTSTLLALFVGWFTLRWVREKGETTLHSLLTWFRARFLKKAN